MKQRHKKQAIQKRMVANANNVFKQMLVCHARYPEFQGCWKFAFGLTPKEAGVAAKVKRNTTKIRMMYAAQVYKDLRHGIVPSGYFYTVKLMVILMVRGIDTKDEKAIATMEKVYQDQIKRLQ